MISVYKIGFTSIVFKTTFVPMDSFHTPISTVGLK